MDPTVVAVAPELFVVTAATAIAELIDLAIASRGECSLSLCGGTTPAPVYRDLVRRAVDWSRVAIFFGDERAVPADHRDSNYAMVRRELLERVPIAADRIHRMAAERTDRDTAAREYERVMPSRLDVLLLGVGADGHTASLFPGSPAVHESTRRVLAVASPPLPVQPQVGRMTITPPVIAAARRVMVLVRGADKAAMLRQVLEGPLQTGMLPAQLARAGTWIVDQAAAAQLQSRER